MAEHDEQDQPAYGRARERLVAMKRRGVVLGLERMRAFLAQLGDPQAQVPCIHIAGTNGKGSVAAMVEAILRECGWRTGLYTSPHLIRLGERIQVDRQPLTNQELTAYVDELAPIAAGLGEAAPSYFEFMTAMAFLHFARRGCAIGVIEVGLGGRLDATNVVVPEVSVITSIGLDHVEALGGTLTAIAREKAGIIKPDRPVVIGRLPREAEEVVRAVARERGCTVASVREQWGDAVADYPETNLPGDYQRWNAATAALAVRQLPVRWRITASAGMRGLQQVAWPGRWQRIVVGDRSVVVDTSHNSEGAEVLATNLAQLAAEQGRKPVLVLGVLGFERARALVPAACAQAREVILVKPAQARACEPEILRTMVPSDFGGVVRAAHIADLFPTPEACRAGERGDTIVVTGSIYLAGETLSRLTRGASPSESELQDF